MSLADQVALWGNVGTWFCKGRWLIKSKNNNSTNNLKKGKDWLHFMCNSLSTLNNLNLKVTSYWSYQIRVAERKVPSSRKWKYSRKVLQNCIWDKYFRTFLSYFIFGKSIFLFLLPIYISSRFQLLVSLITYSWYLPGKKCLSRSSLPTMQLSHWLSLKAIHQMTCSHKMLHATFYHIRRTNPHTNWWNYPLKRLF